MAKIKDLDVWVENKERKNEEKGKEGGGEGRKQRDRNEITGGDRKREWKEEQVRKMSEKGKRGRSFEETQEVWAYVEYKPEWWEVR